MTTAFVASLSRFDAGRCRELIPREWRRPNGVVVFCFRSLVRQKRTGQMGATDFLQTTVRFGRCVRSGRWTNIRVFLCSCFRVVCV